MRGLCLLRGRASPKRGPSPDPAGPAAEGEDSGLWHGSRPTGARAQTQKNQRLCLQLWRWRPCSQGQGAQWGCSRAARLSWKVCTADGGQEKNENQSLLLLGLLSAERVSTRPSSPAPCSDPPMERGQVGDRFMGAEARGRSQCRGHPEPTLLTILGTRSGGS